MGSTRDRSTNCVSNTTAHGPAGEDSFGTRAARALWHIVPRVARRITWGTSPQSAATRGVLAEQAAGPPPQNKQQTRKGVLLPASAGSLSVQLLPESVREWDVRESLEEVGGEGAKTSGGCCGDCQKRIPRGICRCRASTAGGATGCYAASCGGGGVAAVQVVEQQVAGGGPQPLQLRPRAQIPGAAHIHLLPPPRLPCTSAHRKGSA